MQLYNFSYTDKEDLQTYISTNKIDKCNDLLIQIFSGILQPKKMQEISSTLKDFLPNAHIIGTTTSGEISNGKMLENSLVISFSLFQHTSIKSNLYKFDKNFDFSKIKKDLFTDTTKALILFSDGIQSDTEPFLRMISSIDPSVAIAGGRAGDNAKFKDTYVFNDKGFTNNGCVLATLNSEELIVNNDYMLNWTTIGKEMLVTKCKNDILYELDGIPILEVYKKYLGDDVLKNLPSSCMSFPLIIKRGDIDIARDPVALVGNNALMYAGDFTQGDSVRFSFANISDLTDNIEEYFTKLSQYPAEAVYIYSCTARKALLKEKLQDELNLLESLAPSAGFFTYGEFFQSTRMTELLNVTTTFMILSETKKCTKRTLKKTQKRECDPIKKALTHLVKVTTRELEHISTHDILTSLYNRAEYIKIMDRKIKSAQRYKEKFGLILIDLDHFKLVNDNYGHNTGDKVLQAFAEILRKNVREDDFVGRWGGEEFVIIANHAGEKELEKLTKKLQKKIATLKVGPITRITASFGLTVFHEGDTDEKMFARVDNALYIAKQSGRDKYILG